MSVGNWRTHIIVDCKVCHNPMGHHVATAKATCNECKTKGSEE